MTARMHIPAGPAERSRLSHPSMSTDRIMAAALQIVDTDGSTALTMRRLGQALDRKLRDLAAAFRGIALAHPHAVPLLVTRPLTSLLG